MVQVNASPDLFDPVDDIVQGRGQVTDVVAIDGRDECAVQGAEHLVGDLVAGVFDVLQVTRFALDVDVVLEQVVQKTRAFQDVVGASVEEIEETGVLWDQPKSCKHGLT